MNDLEKQTLRSGEDMIENWGMGCRWIPGGGGCSLDDRTHVGFPLVFDRQEDVVQLIQLFLRVPRGAADRDHHYVLQHYRNKKCCWWDWFSHCAVRWTKVRRCQWFKCNAERWKVGRSSDSQIDFIENRLALHLPLLWGLFWRAGANILSQRIMKGRHFTWETCQV